MDTLCFLLAALALVASCHGSNLCANTDDLKQHIVRAFNYKRSYMQQMKKNQTFNYITNIFNNIATQVNGEAYSHTFEKVHEDAKRNAINAVLIVKGSRWGTEHDKVSLLGTHYDTVTGSPGVDDNGSASSALLEVAKAVGRARCDRRNSIIFVMFDWEEYYLSGSKAFVNNHLVPAILERNNVSVEQFVGAFILDSVLDFEDEPKTQSIPPGFGLIFPYAMDKVRANDYAGDFLTSIGRQDDRELMDLIQKNFNGSSVGKQRFRVIDLNIPFAALLMVRVLEGDRWWSVPMPYKPDSTWYNDQIGLTINRWIISHREYQQMASRPSNSLIAPLLRDLFRSDHYYFWDYEGSYSYIGLKAVFLTDTTQFRGYMRHCYDAECDNENHMTHRRLQFMAATANALTNSLLELAMESNQCKCHHSNSN